MKEERVFEYLVDALAYAKSKHPEFPDDPEGGFAIIAEEMLELIRAINDEEGNERILDEALHVAVTAIRFVEERLK